MENAVNFWDLHGFWFVFFLFLFPRITMLVATSVASTYGGFLFWTGWLLAPRVTVAMIGTMQYWDTNSVVCVLAWFWALGGEGAEKGTFGKRARRRWNWDRNWNRNRNWGSD